MPSRSETVDALLNECGKVLSRRERPIFATRRILGHLRALDIDDDNIVLPLVGFESETDDYPAPHLRGLYTASLLAKLDAEAAAKEDFYWPSVKAALETIVARAGSWRRGQQPRR